MSKAPITLWLADEANLIISSTWQADNHRHIFRLSDSKLNLEFPSGQPLVSSLAPSESTAFGATRPFKPARSCGMCNSNHGLFQCNTCKLLEPKMRSKFVKEKRLCFNCLCPGHFTRECRKKFRCTVQGCGKKTLQTHPCGWSYNSCWDGCQSGACQ